MAKENNLPIQTVTPYNTVSHTSPSFVYRVLQPIQLDYNMALRADEDHSNSPLPGLNYFWQDAEKPPGYDWEQWIQLFEVATLARHSISVSEVLREADQQNPRAAALMGNLEEIPAKRKVVSLLYISIGKNARKC